VQELRMTWRHISADNPLYAATYNGQTALEATPARQRTNPSTVISFQRAK